MEKVIFIGLGILFVVIQYGFYRIERSYTESVRDGTLFFMGLISNIVICLGLSIFLFSNYGLYPGIEEGIYRGELVGITKSGEGRTCEIKLNIGGNKGNKSNVYSSRQFSVSNKEIEKGLRENIGKRIQIEYTKWRVMPKDRGETNYDVISFEVIEKNENP